MFSSIKNGFFIGLRQWRIAAIVYIIQLCLALTLGMEAYNVLESSIGNSLEINKLINNYDHTVLTDFLKVHGASITPLIGQLRWLLLTWLLFAVFLDAGLIYCATSFGRDNGRVFFQGGATYYFSFLKIGLFFMVLAIIWTLLIWVPFGMFFEPSITFFPSEAYTVWMAIALLLLYLTGLAVLFVWSVNCRLEKINTQASIRQCLTQSRRRIWASKSKALILIGIFAVFQLVLIYVYHYFGHAISANSAWMIFGLFVIQQVFIFFRIQVRQMMYASINLAYNN